MCVCKGERSESEQRRYTDRWIERKERMSVGKEFDGTESKRVKIW